MTQALPVFSQIDPTQIKARVEQLIAVCTADIEAVVKDPIPSWQSLIVALEENSDELSKFWSPVSHLNSV